MTKQMPSAVRPVSSADRRWARGLLRRRWGTEVIVSRGRTHDAGELPGFIAESLGKRKGLVTYRISNRSCEIVTLDSLAQGRGLGSALIRATIRAAQRAGCSRVWLITTNDNVRALRFTGDAASA